MRLVVVSSLFLVAAVNALVVRSPSIFDTFLIENKAQVNSHSNKCMQGSFFVLTDKVVKEKAAESCAAHNAELANVDNSNFDLVTTLLHGCLGNEARGWIKSWDGTDYGSDCLTLFTGHTVPGGGIDTDCIAPAQAPICSLYPVFDPIFPPFASDPLSTMTAATFTEATTVITDPISMFTTADTNTTTVINDPISMFTTANTESNTVITDPTTMFTTTTIDESSSAIPSSSLSA